jgi:hypothetical protein
MLHVVKQIEDRFPGARGRTVPTLLAVSAVALAIGLVLVLAQ